MRIQCGVNRSLTVKLLLKSGASYTALDNKGVSPLMLAAARGYEKMIGILIDAGADIHVIDNNGNSVIHYAAMSGNLSTVDQLLEKGVPIDLKNKQGKTALSVFASKQKWAPVRHLIKRGADANVPMNRESTVAIYLLMNPELGMSDLIKKNQVNVNSGSAYKSPLLTVLKKCDIEGVKTLLSLGIDVKAALPGGQFVVPYVTGLEPTTCESKSILLRLLLDKGADINARQGRNSTTALSIASQKNYKDVVELLLKYGADVNSLHSQMPGLALAAAVKNKVLRRSV